MGYYSVFSYKIKDAELISDGKEIIETFFADNKDFKLYGFHKVKLEVENGKLRGISPIGYEEKFYDDRLFAEKLSEVLKSGYVYLLFDGEDGESWGYRVGPHEIKELEKIWIPIEYAKDVVEKYAIDI